MLSLVFVRELCRLVDGEGYFWSGTGGSEDKGTDRLSVRISLFLFVLTVRHLGEMTGRIDGVEATVAVAHVELFQYLFKVFLLRQVYGFIGPVSSDLDADKGRLVDWSGSNLEVFVEVVDDLL